MDIRKQLIILILVLLCAPVSAQKKEKLITLKFTNIPLSEAMPKVEKQSGYTFFYESQQIDIKQKVSLNVKNETINKTIAALLKGTNVKFEIDATHIILYTGKNNKAISGQPQNISGTVIDESGEPIIGANVMVEGTSTGVITDLDGKYTINAPAGSNLKISYIGYASQSITLANAQPLKVVMGEDTQTLEEVVVTALGIKREQKALSYNVQQVMGDELTNIKDANFINALSGKVAGVTIKASSAGAGAAARVVMRGTKSLEKNDNALYVIDGIPMFNVNSGDNAGGTMNKQPGSNSVADINPEDIESMTILTGPSAAALYGSDASNGVILITTKKGTVGKVQISYSNSTSFSSPMMMPKFQNIYGNREGELGSWGSLMDTPSNFDPSDFFNTGMTEMNGFTLTTGTEQNQTYASVSTTNSTGILPNNAYNRYNFSIRNTAKFCDNKLSLDLGAQYIIQNNKNMVGSGQYFNPLVSLYLFPRGENFQEVQMYERYSEARNLMVQYWPESIFGTDLDMQNPYWIMNRMQNELSKRRYMFSASLKWDITDWVNVTGRVRVDN